MDKGYAEYLRSDHWKKFRKMYAQSGRWRFCLVCLADKYTLHHLTYKNLYNEDLDDVIPLCWVCHKKYHEYCDIFNTALSSLLTVLRDCFGWDKSKAKRIIEEFRGLKEPTHNKLKSLHKVADAKAKARPKLKEKYGIFEENCDLVFKIKFTKFGYAWWKSESDFYTRPQPLPVGGLLMKELDLLCDFLLTVKPRKRVLIHLSVFELYNRIHILIKEKDVSKVDLPNKHKEILLKASLWNDLTFRCKNEKILCDMIESACADLGVPVDLKESDRELRSFYPKPIDYKKIERDQVKAFNRRKRRRR